MSARLTAATAFHGRWTSAASTIMLNPSAQNTSSSTIA